MKIITLLFVFYGLILPAHSNEEERYQQIYHKQCATCHGDKGDGNGRAGASLTPPPTNFLLQKNGPRLTEDNIKKAIKLGVEGTSMSAYGRRFDERTLDGLTQYIVNTFVANTTNEIKKTQAKVIESSGEGAELYARHCSACHGDKGGAAVWARNALKPPPRDFTSEHSKKELTRERMLASVTYGRVGTAMMSFEKRLTLQQRQTLVNYIREELMGLGGSEPTLPKKPGVNMTLPYINGLQGDIVSGKAIFEKSCFACHGKKGDGKGPRAHFNTPRPRNFVSEESKQSLNRPVLYQGIAQGKLGTVMPAWSHVLNEQQIVDVAEYVFQTFVQGQQSLELRNELDKKKVLNKPSLYQRGRDIYNYRCYFCHGYSGDAKTLASSYLTPPPIAFTAKSLEELSYVAMQTAVREGKKNTAMMAFSRMLSEEDIKAVVMFVRQAFMIADAKTPIKNTKYHTVANGWTDHDKYQLAYPFALGEIALDSPWEDLTELQRQGKRLYLSACVICHDRAKVNDEGGIWQSRPISWPRNAYSHKTTIAPLDAISQASPYALHDVKVHYVAETDKEKQGQTLFQNNCAFCHGADGTGKNWIGQFLEPPARNFTVDNIQESYSQALLKNRVQNGVVGTAMPAWKYVLTEEEIESIVAFMWNRFKAH